MLFLSLFLLPTLIAAICNLNLTNIAIYSYIVQLILTVRAVKQRCTYNTLYVYN